MSVEPHRHPLTRLQTEHAQSRRRNFGGFGGQRLREQPALAIAGLADSCMFRYGQIDAALAEPVGRPTAEEVCDGSGATAAISVQIRCEDR